jgi:hypothetical protein
MIRFRLGRLKRAKARAPERGVHAASTWKNERFRIAHVSMNVEREAA